jgi:hypothetical protein
MNYYSSLYLREYNNHYDNQNNFWTSSLSLCVFYGMFGYMCKKAIDTYYETINSSKPIKDYPCYKLNSINPSHNDTYKQTLFNNLLSINSLERCYILYFIFKTKGNFKSVYEQNNNLDASTDTINYTTDTTDTTDTKIEKEYNSYELYNKMIQHYNLSEEYINLDETSEPEIKLQIGDIKYEMTVAQLTFIHWIYYTGLYDYLIDRPTIKYNILNEMNEKCLLTGNVFLRYQLFLCDYEYELKLKETDEPDETDEPEETEETDDTDEKNDSTDDESNDLDESNELEENDDCDEENNSMKFYKYKCMIDKILNNHK